MRKMFLGLTAVAGASMVALPAAAEARPTVEVGLSVGSAYAPYGRYDHYDRYDRYGYDNWGYDRRGRYDARRHFAYGKVRELQHRVGTMRQDIRYFVRQGAIDHREFRKLDRKADRLQRRIDRLAYRGLNRGEYRIAVRGIHDLRRDIQRDLRDGRRWQRHGYGYHGARDRYWNDDDRWERDRRWDRRERRWDRRDRDDEDWDD